MSKTTTKKTPDFTEDFFNLLNEVQNPKKTEEGYEGRYTYTPLPELLTEIKPVLAKHYFVIWQGFIEGELVTELRHITGEMRVSSIKLFYYEGNAQKTGSWISYMRRYSILTILGIAGEDDDGEVLNAKRETKPVASSIPNVQLETEVLDGITYTRRKGTSKLGKPYDAWFPPREMENAKVYWSDEAFQEAKSSAGSFVGDSPELENYIDDLPY